MSEFKSWDSYGAFSRRIRGKRRFVWDPADEEFLRQLAITSKSRVRNMKSGTGLWRAQLGYEMREDYFDGKYAGELPTAYLPERMKPKQGRAREGRANPKGIPVLYLATRPETAMSEVRPWVGSWISCAHLETTRSLKIIDLTLGKDQKFAIYFEEPDPPKREESVWSQIGHAFSTPVSSIYETADYEPTQVIAELLKTEGYDGISYTSAFGDDGQNVALFNLDDAEIMSCALHDVRSVEFNFRQFENPYFIVDKK